jgi:hypothetical protein
VLRVKCKVNIYVQFRLSPYFRDFGVQCGSKESFTLINDYMCNNTWCTWPRYINEGYKNIDYPVRFTKY